MPYALSSFAEEMSDLGFLGKRDTMKFLSTFRSSNLSYVSGRHEVLASLNELLSTHLKSFTAERLPDGTYIVLGFWGLNGMLEEIRQLCEIRDKANDKAPATGGGRGNFEQDDAWRSFNDSHLRLAILRRELASYLTNRGNLYGRVELETKLGAVWS